MAEIFKEVKDKDENDSFFSPEDRALFKSSFTKALKNGVAVASFIAPIILVYAVGSLICSIGRSSD